ncbi:MAG: hypothetical protein IPM17_00405 [Verrucomicrobia bacterium]|nr:hypothetical protein [Verrucomicrobiota bacterium]
MKLLEMTARVLADVLRARTDVVWLHDLDMVLVPALARRFLTRRSIRLVWDQHEYPASSMLTNKGFAAWFRRSNAACDCVLHANAARRDALVAWLGERRAESHLVLENLPARDFAGAPRQELPQKVQAWLQLRPFLVNFGGLQEVRRGRELVEAILRFRKAALVVVGASDSALCGALENVHGARFREWVYLQPSVPYAAVPAYLDSAAGSVILYRADEINRKYCASNKLYEALARGCPVLVGNNPPLQQAVNETGAGVVLEDDGESIDGICAAMEKLLCQRHDLSAALLSGSPLVWETQERVLALAIGRSGGMD